MYTCTILYNIIIEDNINAISDVDDYYTSSPRVQRPYDVSYQYAKVKSYEIRICITFAKILLNTFDDTCI